MVEVDSSAPTCSLLLKYTPSSGTSKQKRKRLTLNTTHTCGELYRYVKQELAKEEGGGEGEPGDFLLLSGFPPSSLTTLDLTLQEAGLDGDQLTLQWT